MTSNTMADKLRLLLTAAPLALAGFLVVSGFGSLTEPSGGGDLQLRWTEQQYVLLGINPFDVRADWQAELNRNPSAQPLEGLHRSILASASRPPATRRGRTARQSFSSGPRICPRRGFATPRSTPSSSASSHGGSRRRVGFKSDSFHSRWLPPLRSTASARRSISANSAFSRWDA